LSKILGVKKTASTSK